MKFDAKTIWALVSTIIAIIALGAQYCKPGKVNPNLFPKDTVYVDKLIIVNDTIEQTKYHTKPVYVEKYKTDTLTLVKNKTDTLKIPVNQITAKFPSILSGEFDQDHIRLLTRDTTGSIYSDLFLTDYNLNSYTYDGYTRRLSARPKTGGDLSDDFGENVKKLRLKNFSSNAYLLYGTRNNFMLRGDASLNYKKLGLYLYGQLNTAMPNTEAGAGIKYSIR